MKIAVAVPKISIDKESNINKMSVLIKEAALNYADIVLFPEAVLTGLINCDIYEEDVKLTNTIDDQQISYLKKMAQDLKIWLCFGFFELCDGVIYDSAVLIDDNGDTSIHYRRINPQWRAKNLPKEQYAEGFSVSKADTPFGIISILICGDLFDDSVLEMMKANESDILLFPFARCFSSRVNDELNEWENIEKHDYVKRAAMTGSMVIMSNYIADKTMNSGGFGGALIISKDGMLLASLPIYQEGILYYDI